MDKKFNVIYKSYLVKRAITKETAFPYNHYIS